MLGFVLGSGDTEMSCVWVLLLRAHGSWGGAVAHTQKGSTKKGDVLLTGRNQGLPEHVTLHKVPKLRGLYYYPWGSSVNIVGT